MNVLTLREHETFAICDTFSCAGRKSVTHAQVDALERLSQRLKAAKGGLFTHANRTTLKARQYVGVVQLGAEAIEIIPKIDGLDEQNTRTNLFRMLARTRRLEIHEADIALLAAQNLNILEIYIRLFCDKLFAEVHRGLISRYERHTDNLPALRGKLLTGLQATLNVFQPERFRCEFDEFTVDTPLNRVLKTTVRFLRRVTRHDDNARRLAELDLALDGVSDVSAAALEWHRLHFDRANRRYASLVAMARLILQNRTQDVTAGGLEGFSLLFDMNELFEEYIGEVAREVFTPLGWQVALQGPSRYLLQDRESGAQVFQTQPDITGSRDGNPAWIIDTKWKRLDEQERNQGIAQADVYQMLGYARRYDVENLFLLYPHQPAAGDTPGLQRSFHFLGDASGGHAQHLHVATVDLTDLRNVSAQLISILDGVPVTLTQPA
ncbi:MAG: McrC family protein [Pseudomonadota bacterium]|nr:McrC family protein [Pseudomonadota bacterium]MDP1905456.1 McrC family protein [Pseudomonadota bacterium]MDP2351065.1 McrC family protein [Pseudomonadota bacterium]